MRYTIELLETGKEIFTERNILGKTLLVIISPIFLLVIVVFAFMDCLKMFLDWIDIITKK